MSWTNNPKSNLRTPMGRIIPTSRVVLLQNHCSRRQSNETLSSLPRCKDKHQRTAMFQLWNSNQVQGKTALTLKQWEKEMIADMLQRTKTASDLDANIEKMSGSPMQPSKQCLEVYRELATLRIKRPMRSS